MATLLARADERVAELSRFAGELSALLEQKSVLRAPIVCAGDLGALSAAIERLERTGGRGGAAADQTSLAEARSLQNAIELCTATARVAVLVRSALAGGDDATVAAMDAKLRGLF